MIGKTKYVTLSFSTDSESSESEDSDMTHTYLH